MYREETTSGYSSGSPRIVFMLEESTPTTHQLKQALGEANAGLDAMIEAFAQALDAREKEPVGYTSFVAETTVRLAGVYGIDPAEFPNIRRGALLHDIGKLYIPESILLKPAKLTGEEWALVRKHPQYASQLLSRIPYLLPALDIPAYHHELWDGSGYPNGLKGEKIPIAARLFSVIDVWNALRSDRPHRKGWPEDKVLDYIQSLAGVNFDPQVVEKFLRMTRLGIGK
jgi:HD-GYP domain-containing protein (c-di-GMP phosphodiesterase class II)